MNDEVLLDLVRRADPVQSVGEPPLALLERVLASPRPGGRPLRASRRAVLFACAVAAAIAPLAALAAANHWWFLRAGAGLPPPAQQPVVVTRGSWSGHRWSLVAFPSRASSKGYGLCWGVTFAGRPPRDTGGLYSVNGQDATRGDDAVSCGSVVGIKHKRLFAPNIPTVMFQWKLGSRNRGGYPGWISGVVAGSATHVVIRWSAKPARPGGLLASPREVVHATTFPAPVAGYDVRLFAVPLPKALDRQTANPAQGLGGAAAWTFPSLIRGTNRNGRLVACYDAKWVTQFGVTPLSICRK